MGKLSDSGFRLWIELLCLACQAGAQGDTKLTVDETAWKLRRNVSETLQELLQLKIVTFHTNGDGRDTIYIPKWKTRQYQSDISTPRVKKHREKLKKDPNETFQ
jgi:hypothetical protein